MVAQFFQPPRTLLVDALVVSQLCAQQPDSALTVGACDPWGGVGNQDVVRGQRQPLGAVGLGVQHGLSGLDALRDRDEVEGDRRGECAQDEGGDSLVTVHRERW